jgi:hypothetical protein
MMSRSGNRNLTAERTQSIHLRSENDQWGQPPASRYSFSIEGEVMYGLVSSMLTSSSDVLANQLNSSIFFLEGVPRSGSETGPDPWDSLGDDELAALYAEAAEEDRQLAQLGLDHYAEILEQEEDAG